MFRFIFLILSLTLFAEVGSAQSSSANPRPEPERVKPVVNILEQAGTPLKISSPLTQWATPDAQILEIYVQVENVSELEISAYAWRTGPTDQNNDGCFMFNIQSSAHVLRTGQSDGKSTWRRVPLDRPPANIDISLDFVEFANGSSWGIDTCKSVERLSGLRAGAHAVKNKFGQIQDENRDKSLINLLKLDALILKAPDGSTAVWVDGFREGVRQFFDKLKMANQQGGLPEVERVLQLPFDASGK